MHLVQREEEVDYLAVSIGILYNCGILADSIENILDLKLDTCAYHNTNDVWVP